MALKKGAAVLREEEIVHQIVSVLRLQKQEVIMLCDGKGMEADATIEAVSKKEVHLLMQEPKQNENEPERRVTLYCALLKRENMEHVFQKATEIGVSVIVPMRTARTIKLDFKRERAEHIIREAAEQSGRGCIPELTEILSFEEALKHAAGQELNLFFDIEATKSPSVSNENTIGICIGPEGGWSDEERAMIIDHKYTSVTLGKRTLRGETAAVVASYLAVTL